MKYNLVIQGMRMFWETENMFVQNVLKYLGGYLRSYQIALGIAEEFLLVLSNHKIRFLFMFLTPDYKHQVWDYMVIGQDTLIPNNQLHQIINKPPGSLQWRVSSMFWCSGMVIWQYSLLSLKTFNQL
eukprot:TRINITY_DN93232_c0_g1_i1.p2 TRINITY_DN93232_c0_g1~~TRINITY_DN93232_c0_g1_i1.p2  ORF type:complete len:127 (+),score=6.25 TRINITY_DN93232_c0_g1_i1:128-508(+)